MLLLHFVFVPQVTLVLPYNSKLPTDISRLEEQQMVYVLKEVQASQLLDKEFVEAFVKRGQLFALFCCTECLFFEKQCKLQNPGFYCDSML